MSQATTNPTAGSENGKPATVKERADLALNNDFLRKAVRFTTERLRDGKQKAANDHGHWKSGVNVGGKSVYTRSPILITI